MLGKDFSPPLRAGPIPTRRQLYEPLEKLCVPGGERARMASHAVTTAREAKIEMHSYLPLSQSEYAS
jgi:hypothetical protein